MDSALSKTILHGGTVPWRVFPLPAGARDNALAPGTIRGGYRRLGSGAAGAAVRPSVARGAGVRKVEASTVTARRLEDCFLLAERWRCP